MKCAGGFRNATRRSWYCPDNAEAVTTSHSTYFCQRCDTERLQRVSEELREFKAILEARGAQ